MKKQIWLIASTTLKIFYLTPSVVFMMITTYGVIDAMLTPNSLAPLYLAFGLIISSIIGIVGLLTVFVVDIVRNKKNQGNKAGWLSYSLHLGIPVIWFVAVTAFLLVIIYGGTEYKYIFEGLFLSYIIGLLCLVAALVIDRIHRKNRITLDYLLYSLYFAIPVIWFTVFLFTSLGNMGLAFM